MIPSGTYIGTLTKAHGYKGEMILRGSSQLLEKLEPGTPLFIAIDELRVPFFLEEITHAAGAEKCIIKLEFINSDKEAIRYTDSKVFQKQGKDKGALEEKTALHISEYLNYKIHDENSKQDFLVKDYIENPANPLIILKPAQKDIETLDQEILLPLNAGFILSINTETKTITAEIPPELLDL